jgi:hypothetical protein
MLQVQKMISWKKLAKGKDSLFMTQFLKIKEKQLVITPLECKVHLNKSPCTGCTHSTAETDDLFSSVQSFKF